MTDWKGLVNDFMAMASPALPAAVNTAEPVSARSVEILRSRGCSSEDWSLVKATPETDIDLVENCRFSGSVTIHLPSGEMRDTAFENALIIGPASIVSTGLLMGITVHPGSTVAFCGRVVSGGCPGFLLDSLQAGLETGERSVPLMPLLNHLQAAELASGEGRNDARGLRLLMEEAAAGMRGFAGPGTTIMCCPLVEDSILLQDSMIDGASSVRGSILLPGSCVRDGAVVRSSVLQWNAVADSMSLVERSVVGECSRVESHGKLTSSFLGADSVLGGGEITASLTGPFTGMHHQSLLIAASWPGGKGNVGYGANVGSNHTSRLPDQEVRPGAGLFFGLGTSVKFPSDLSGSPYSVLATGITTLPQKVEFPFSLITSPHTRPHGVPEGWNRLLPGWMLHANLYAVLRNQWKYRARRRSVNTPVETDVFTPGVLRLVERALGRLEASGEAVPGAGKNFILPEDRLAGIDAYRKCLRFFRLLELLETRRMAAGEAGELLDLAFQLRESVLSSRQKDWSRGGAIIPDYGEIHPAIDQDPFIAELNARVKTLEERLRKIM